VSVGSAGTSGRRRGRVGVLRLDTRFERFARDIGGTEGLPFDVVHETLPGVTALQATEGDEDILPDLVAAAGRLADRGVEVITTSCGFLVLYQQALAACLPVPLISSSLLQIPALARILPARQKIGVLTFNGETLSSRHLLAAGAPADTPVSGLPHHGAFRADILGGPPATTEQRLEEARQAMRHLLECNPAVVAVVAECTNIAPYSVTLAREFGVPVFDLVSQIEWFLSGLAGRKNGP
jgi:hypothetical protein